MNLISRILRKEFAGFFASPVAFIFFGVFLAITLFIFFWVDTFFARNIADVRPLFEWMPILMIFLAAAITMRMWSEERRSGNLEFLLTSPVKPVHLVLGKFMACLCLVAVSLLLTLPLPVSVSFLGRLDWGPVLGGYLATLFLASSYIAIGLYISARSENQIISLILTTVVCGIFYLIGADALTNLVGNKGAEILKLMGTGARFDSINRGVIDLRDLYYYLSLVGVFLALNVFSLEQQRWAGNPGNRKHRQWAWITALLAANFLMGNVVLQPVTSIRTDITAGKLYTISPATSAYLSQLKEPLLIRGYFSAQTHPLLSPLVPRLRDLLQEYAVTGGDRVRVEFIDPLENPELEQEAGQKYGIQPIAFQTNSKYQASVVNSYFDILIKYGDQYETLGFRDLIEVKSQSETELDVELRDPEYDITSAIKKVLYSYQGSGDLFDNISGPVTFNAYVSPAEKLPAALSTLRDDLQSVLDGLQKSAAGKLKVEIHDPDANGGELGRRLQKDFGFRPMATGLFDTNTFWYYMTMENGNQIVQVPFPEDMEKASLERGINAALKRFARGFLKTVALYTPERSRQDPMHFQTDHGYTWLQDILSEEHTLTKTDLGNGQVPDEADLLLVIAPESLDEKQLFAIDQFLMQGGTIIIASSPYDIVAENGLNARKKSSGLEQWLQSHGITINDSMVLDPQNATFPVPVQRNLGGFTVKEMHAVPYPYFIDIRENGMERESGLTAGLDQLTINWASPITLDMEKNKARRVIRLLESSEQSWTSDNLDIQPDFNTNGALGFSPAEKRGRSLLAVLVEGQFDSWFHDKPSPMVKADEDENASEDAADADRNTEPTEGDKNPQTGNPEGTEQVNEDKKDETYINRIIDKSPESARIILVSSSYFLTDDALGLASSTLGTRYLTPVRLVANAVDWSLEDRGLLSIRGRTHYSRTLAPLDQEQQMFWEYFNYALAVFGLMVVWLMRYQGRIWVRRRYAALLNGRTEP